MAFSNSAYSSAPMAGMKRALDVRTSLSSPSRLASDRHDLRRSVQIVPPHVCGDKLSLNEWLTCIVSTCRSWRTHTEARLQATSLQPAWQVPRP